VAAGQINVAPAENGRIDPAEVAALYVQHAGELRRFLYGVLRDADLAGDVLQATFTKAIEAGHTAQQESLKGWLFRVAYNEALALRRREAVHVRATHQIARSDEAHGGSPEEKLVRLEAVRSVRAALRELPEGQREVVRLRIYEQKKFSVIASELGLPLGTVLSRMQSALAKLRSKLQGE